MERPGHCTDSPAGDQRDPPDRPASTRLAGPSAAPDLPGASSPSEEAGPPGLPCPVVLVGLMGAGKTSVGKALARLLHAPFRDGDDEIEAAAQMSIAEIFATYGEPEFRALERRVIARLLEEGPPGVLATGGGAFMAPQTRAVIADKAVSVWLRADLDVLVARTEGRSHRPLLNQGNPREILADLMARRYPVYAGADVTVECSRESPQAMARRVLAAITPRLEQWRRGRGGMTASPDATGTTTPPPSSSPPSVLPSSFAPCRPESAS